MACLVDTDSGQAEDACRAWKYLAHLVSRFEEVDRVDEVNRVDESNIESEPVDELVLQQESCLKNPTR